MCSTCGTFLPVHFFSSGHNSSTVLKSIYNKLRHLSVAQEFKVICSSKHAMQGTMIDVLSADTYVEFRLVSRRMKGVLNGPIARRSEIRDGQIHNFMYFKYKICI